MDSAFKIVTLIEAILVHIVIIIINPTVFHSALLRLLDGSAFVGIFFSGRKKPLSY